MNKGGRPRNPPVDEEYKRLAKLAGWRASKRSDGWVVVGPSQFAYTQTKTYSNATLAWQAAYFETIKRKD